jgi:hypothetical protein
MSITTAHAASPERGRKVFRPEEVVANVFGLSIILSVEEDDVDADVRGARADDACDFQKNRGGAGAVDARRDRPGPQRRVDLLVRPRS